MNLSSILVMTLEPHLESTISALTAIDGLEVHYCDRTSGRIIVTQEAENTHDEVSGLQRIKSLPYVVLAEMVYHYCEQEEEPSLAAAPCQ
jgi:nitrate reductase NapD